MFCIGKELWFYSAVSVPRLNTMVGPLNKQERVRKPSVRRRLENEDIATTKAKGLLILLQCIILSLHMLRYQLC